MSTTNKLAEIKTNLNSPGNYVSRTKTIDTVTIHCLSVYKDLDKLFEYYNRQESENSCNYLIDMDGNIGRNVEETQASKCTSSSSNDARAITIAIVVDSFSPWEVYEETRNSLVELLFDICTRYRIDRLVLNANRLLRAKNINGNVTLFSDFTDDTCEDAGLLSILGELIAEVNRKILDQGEAGSYDPGDTVLPVPATGVGNLSTTSLVLKSDVTSSNEALGPTAMQKNARYIWQYLGARGWKLNAVAGLLGNMQSESTINPGRWQSGREWGDEEDHGYGLVQWTPYTKYTDWCTANSFDMYDIDTALTRILEEVRVDSGEDLTTAGTVEDQWGIHSSYDYNLSFKEFTESTLEPYWLAGAFLANYERPAEFHFDTRGKQAVEWYNYLLPYSNLSPPIIKISQITSITAVSVTVACSLANAIIGTVIKVTVLDSTGKAVNSVSKPTTETTTSQISITVEKLKPNTPYKLLIEVNPESDTTEKEDEELDLETKIGFTTLNGGPESVKGVSLTPLTLPLPDKLFKIEIASLDKTDWGYTLEKQPSLKHGYTLQLIVNGKIVKEKTLSSLNTITTTLDANGYFSVSAIKPGDSVQIGVRTWVEKTATDKMYDNAYAKTSNAISLINNPYIVFIKNSE